MHGHAYMVRVDSNDHSQRRCGGAWSDSRRARLENSLATPSPGRVGMGYGCRHRNKEIPSDETVKFRGVAEYLGRSPTGSTPIMEVP